jgi:hypothetical protein
VLEDSVPETIRAFGIDRFAPRRAAPEMMERTEPA